MGYTFGNKSKKQLDTCHKDLQTICNEVIKSFDFSILEGTRTLQQQQIYFKDNKSKLDGINKKSKHQSLPSMAVDVAPYPINFENKDKVRARFYLLAGYMLQASEQLYNDNKISHKLIWGGDWDNDKDFEDQTFDDLPHFELK